MSEVLRIEHLCKNYGKTAVLSDINLKIESGKIIGIAGRNGAGKTTLIKLINDLLTVSSGNISVCNKPIGVESKKLISYLPDCEYLSRNLTPKALIKMYGEFYADFNKSKAEVLLRDLNLPDLPLYKMSKGMREKVQLVLVMSRNAVLYILDEPFGGVDPATRDYILDIILKNFNEESTLIISTHLISDIERILDEIVFIDGGKIILHENAEDLREKEGKSIDGIFREMFKC